MIEDIPQNKEFLTYLLEENSKVEHEYTEILYRMKYIDEQLISMGKQDAITNMVRNVRDKVKFNENEKKFIWFAFRESMDDLKVCLAVCKNPIEYISMLIKNSRQVYYTANLGIMIENIFLEGKFLKNFMEKENVLIFQYDGIKYKTDTADEVFYFDVNRRMCGKYPTITILLENNYRRFLKSCINNPKLSIEGNSILCMELYEKILNKKIDIENLLMMYERKMQLIYTK